MKPATTGLLLILASLGLVVYLKRTAAAAAAPTVAIPGQPPLTLNLSDVGAKLIKEDRGPEIVKALLNDQSLRDTELKYEEAKRVFSRIETGIAPGDIAP